MVSALPCDYWKMRLYSGLRALIHVTGSRAPTGAYAFAAAVQSHHSSVSGLTPADLAAEVNGIRGQLAPGNSGRRERVMALIVESARRSLGLTAYAEQLAAVACLLNRRVVDMATGEGKTLVGFISAAALALTGHRVHVISANDYLARRDALSSTEFFERLGMTVSSVDATMSRDERSRAYLSNTVYGTAHQIGFDLLRDRLRTAHQDRLLPPFDAALIDEVDAVLIDDATVPLVISGDRAAPASDRRIAEIVASLTEHRHFTIAEDHRSVEFTDAGIAALEQALHIRNIFDEENSDLLAAAHVSLHAEALLKRDVHYVLSHGRIALVSEPRGRIVEGQRWPDGLQSAVELKEGLDVTGDTRILDQILVENLARQYRFLAGMSGSAAEASERLGDDFGLDTVVIPPHRTPIRIDDRDRLFLTAHTRDNAAADLVLAAHASGQPVLIGTQSVQASLSFARALRRRGLEPHVLNAKNDDAEAKTIAQAGERGAITVSTQMAGRGVDIPLDAAAVQAGGLLVIGVERYGTRRLDRQLRGRAGRQGDPGRTVFYTSLDDAVFNSNIRVTSVPAASPTGEIQDLSFARIYAHAQRIQEGKILQLHRTTRQYSSVIDGHRTAILSLREALLRGDFSVPSTLASLGAGGPLLKTDEVHGLSPHLIRDIALYLLDRSWSEYLMTLSEVREGIHLRILGRENPLEEFTFLAATSLDTAVREFTATLRSTVEQAPTGATALSDLGLARPTTTWTYTTTDNPFGSEIDRIVSTVSRSVRGGRRRFEYR